MASNRIAEQMIETDPIQQALKLPGGGRFYKCALQVNPFEYLRRHNKTSNFSNETAYNQAIVQACLQNHIEVIAITDHYRIRSAQSLIEAARLAGLYVLPGFEASTKEGIHLLCIFDPDRSIDQLERIIGECSVHDDSTDSPTGKYDVYELLEQVRNWNSVCIAAHVCSNSGLLKVLTGQARINAWKSSHLTACSLPGPVAETPDDVRPIIQNKNPDYRRERPIAVLNAQDVSSPEDLVKPGASCWIKMSEVSIEGIRQAFLDPMSRIRLASDPEPEEHAELVAIAWQGGFLDGVAIHFNENLNVLIGGRGAGKSTVVESLRYVLGLEPLGEEARKLHEGIVRHVLRSGTKISLLVRSHKPTKREYRIERTVPNPPVVKGGSGEVLNLGPSDVVSRVEVYGQHEISELTKSPEKLTRLLERFVSRDAVLTRRKGDLKRELERSRVRILDINKEMKQIEERLASLPALEEMLRRFQDAKLEERLKEQSHLVREERIIKTIPDRIAPLRELLDQLRQQLPIDLTFLSPKALEGLPGKDIISQADSVIERLSNEFGTIANQMTNALTTADKDLAVVRERWEERKKVVQTAYEKILRELQKSKVDGEEFIHLRRQIEDLRPLKERLKILQKDKKQLNEHRKNLLAEWEDLKTADFRQIDSAAKKVSKQLADRVRVRVTFAGNREPLIKLLREQIGGRLSEVIDMLQQREDLSLKEFADAVISGRDALAARYSIPPAQADRLSQAPQEVVMQIEELDLSPITKIELNVAAEGQSAVLKTLDELSTGQKATAVLLLLLLESDAPLVVDQPEDDLDNRFITEGVVPKMREEKRRRQFVFSTHNANIPVLGDAELIIGLSATGEANHGHAAIPAQYMGSIDNLHVRELMEEILEGGKEAFEMRRLKYGF